MDLQTFLPYQLSVLSNKISSGIAKYYKEQHDISIPEWRVLALLGNCSKLTAKDLCQQSQMDKVRISRTVKALEKKALISEDQCKIDARSRRYTLTKQGISLIKIVKPKAQEFEKQLRSSLSDTQLSEFLLCIERLSKQADKIIEENN